MQKRKITVIEPSETATNELELASRTTATYDELATELKMGKNDWKKPDHLSQVGEEDPSEPSVRDRQDLLDGLNEAFSEFATSDDHVRTDTNVVSVRMERPWQAPIYDSITVRAPDISSQSVPDEMELFLPEDDDDYIRPASADEESSPPKQINSASEREAKEDEEDDDQMEMDPSEPMATDRFEGDVSRYGRIRKPTAKLQK